MRILRVAFGEQAFYAAPQGDELHCLFPLPGIPEVLPRKDVDVLPVVAPGKIICAALNYPGFAEEAKMPVPSSPTFFFKPPSAIVGPGQSILLPSEETRVDFGGELAVIIGRMASHIKPRDVPHHLFGYTCANDVLARDLHLFDPKYCTGRGYDTFCPVGPWIETNISNLAALSIQTHVNGELRQNNTIANMVFDPYVLISTLSQTMTLYPGDLVLTGTPEGSGPMGPGDVVSVTISQLGSLSNPVTVRGDESYSTHPPTALNQTPWR